MRRDVISWAVTQDCDQANMAQSAEASGRATASSDLRSAATPQTAATTAAAIIRAAPNR